ncbi:flagellar filament capping protein FliD [Kushneria indalinina]|uniref:Flagellar hook-associated protein 2 n=1 Tax=Kushneria indalinina DSM 14324 TaxID=1122140 RepID=A0A3D9E016_9GAMM|nr:flagellar filament capping protein FliD [Kushneria indalinina]REC96368.1 flagellar hook-associated protein 2 [Kushneria indalinina DSM 14324]
MAIESLGVGSSLDLTSLLSGLKSAEQEKLAPINSKLSSTNAKLSGFGQLTQSLESFQTAAQKLNSPKLYEGFATKVSGSALTATAGSTAAAGSYDIKINSLATAQSLATTGRADTTSAIGTGTLSVKVGDKSTDVEITDGSLAGIRDAINKSDAGVTASIVNDGSGTPYRLVLSSETTGAASKMSLSSDNSDLSALFSGATETVAAADASLTVNGLAIKSASNTVEEAIQGVTLNLVETTAEGASTKLTVSQDTDSVKTAVQDFVKAYNSLADKITSLTKVDAEGDKVKGAALTGNSTVRSVQSTLRNVMSSAVGGEGMNYLFEAGVSFSKDLTKSGKLEISDEKTLDDALANNLDGVKGLFAGDGKTGIAAKLDTSITQMLTNNGAVASAKSGLESSVKSLEARSLRMQDTIDATVERYKKQFQQLDVMMSKLNNTQSYLTQQFDALNGASKN